MKAKYQRTTDSFKISFVSKIYILPYADLHQHQVEKEAERTFLLLPDEDLHQVEVIRIYSVILHTGLSI